MKLIISVCNSIIEDFSKILERISGVGTGYFHYQRPYMACHSYKIIPTGVSDTKEKNNVGGYSNGIDFMMWFLTIWQLYTYIAIHVS